MGERVLTYLDLSVDAIPAALRAFERDSQVGSALAREVGADRTARLEPRHWEMVRDLVRRYPVDRDGIPAASFALPQAPGCVGSERTRE